MEPGRQIEGLASDLTVAGAVADVARSLSGLPTDYAAEARMLVCAAAGIQRLDLLRDPGRKLGEPAAAMLRTMVQRRLQREPVTRIIGRRGFWSLDMEVAPEVLDPRGDTETIVEAALELLGRRRADPIRILDLGTGSGVILCALLSEFVHATGVAVDLSEAACDLCRRNLQHNGLAARATVIAGSWTHAVEGRYDLIVSNPPYIESGVIPDLDPEVKHYDPLLALDGGSDGLDAYRSIAGLIPGWMCPESIVIFEVGDQQATSVTEVMGRAGLRPLGRWRDLGGHDRALAFAAAELPGSAGS
jgi:release factor glutamine methyltransferase